MSGRRRALLIINPMSGGKPGAGPPLADDPERLTPTALAAALEAHGMNIEVQELTPEDDVTAIARGAADGGRDVIVGGGDGTVSAAAAALVGRGDAALGILALGSFNNIARGYGVPTTLDAALDVIAADDPTPMDCGWVVRDDGGEPFFEAAGVGIDAVGFLAVQIAGRHGWRRAAGALWRGLRMRRTPMRITLDERTFTTGTPAVTVSNGPYHGLGFAISPDADATDGLLDAAIFAGMSTWDVLRHFLAVARRRPRREPGITIMRAGRVRIEGRRRALPAHADGISIGATPVTLEVRPGALRVFR
jgi:diacylglycerol kinase family enzyme